MRSTRPLRLPPLRGPRTAVQRDSEWTPTTNRARPTARRHPAIDLRAGHAVAPVGCGSVQRRPVRAVEGAANTARMRRTHGRTAPESTDTWRVRGVTTAPPGRAVAPRRVTSTGQARSSARKGRAGRGRTLDAPDARNARKACFRRSNGATNGRQRRTARGRRVLPAAGNPETVEPRAGAAAVEVDPGRQSPAAPAPCSTGQGRGARGGRG